MLVKYVPGRYTPKLLVMDVGINHPFKVHFQQSFAEAQQEYCIGTWFREEIQATSL